MLACTPVQLGLTSNSGFTTRKTFLYRTDRCATLRQWKYYRRVCVDAKGGVQLHSSCWIWIFIACRGGGIQYFARWDCTAVCIHVRCWPSYRYNRLQDHGMPLRVFILHINEIIYMDNCYGQFHVIVCTCHSSLREWLDVRYQGIITVVMIIVVWTSSSYNAHRMCLGTNLWWTYGAREATQQPHQRWAIWEPGAHHATLSDSILWHKYSGQLLFNVDLT